MTINWYGQSCFRLEFKEGSVLVDPFSKEIGLKPPNIRDDVVLVSHDHSDHNNVEDINPEALPRAQECYRKLGPHVASVHVKDLAWDVEMAVHFREVPVGRGSINHAVLLGEHARHAPEAPLMLEHLASEAEYDESHAHLLAAAGQAGVAFERMKLTSQGELRPKVPKKDAQSRALNRRVNFLPLP